MSSVVLSILETDLESLLAAMAAVPQDCAWIEIRADLLRAEQVEQALAAAPRQVIVTVRSAAEGGLFMGSAEEHRVLLTRALAAGARFVDVEWQGPLSDLATGPDAARVVLSHHGAPCSMPHLLPLYRAMAATPAARLKIVPRATSAVELGAVRDLLSLARAEGRALACFALGAAGTPSRILAPSWGSWATYGASRVGKETAAGQITALDLLEVYDVLRIGAATRLYGLLGTPLERSPSPAMHAAGYRELAIDARYLPIDASRIEEVLALLGRDGILGIEGFGVTIPLKEAAAARCHLADGWSRASGSINTVVVEEKGWTGFNTDAPAALALVRRHLDPEGRAVAVLGAGGTARALGAALRSAGASVTFFNRDRSRAEAVAASVGGAAGDLLELPQARWDVLVQATPLGRQGEEVLPARALTGRLVLDVVYGPGATPLVRDARAQGLAVVDGFEMLLEQALLQFARLTGKRPTRDVLRDAGARFIATAAGSGRA